MTAIQFLTGHSFAELSNLVELDLSFNFFERLPMDGLKNLKNLKFLNLGSNKIKVSHSPTLSSF